MFPFRSASLSFKPQTFGQLSIKVGNWKHSVYLFALYIAECLSVHLGAACGYRAGNNCSQQSSCKRALPVNKLDSGNFGWMFIVLSGNNLPDNLMTNKLPLCVFFMSLSLANVMWQVDFTSDTRPGYAFPCWRPLSRIIWCSCVAL